MAIVLCFEISSIEISPQISFSHDLKNAKDDDDGDDPLEDYCRRRPDLCMLDSSSDFVFYISNNVLYQELSSADELFSNCKIVPTKIKKSKSPNVPLSCSSSYSEIHPFSESGVCPRSETLSTGITEKKKRLIEFLNEEEKPPTFMNFINTFNHCSDASCNHLSSKSFVFRTQKDCNFNGNNEMEPDD